jgi:hypothetical protein
MGGYFTCWLCSCLLQNYHRRKKCFWICPFLNFIIKMLVCLFRFLDHRFPIIECTCATTDRLAIGSALLFISKEQPVPPVPQVLWTATACVWLLFSQQLSRQPSIPLRLPLNPPAYLHWSQPRLDQLLLLLLVPITATLVHAPCQPITRSANIRYVSSTSIIKCLHLFVEVHIWTNVHSR